MTENVRGRLIYHRQSPEHFHIFVYGPADRHLATLEVIGRTVTIRMADKIVDARTAGAQWSSA